MPNAFFHFVPHAPFKSDFGIFILGNGEPERARKALAAAARNRRHKVKFERDAFIPHISAAFIQLGSELKYTRSLADDPDVHFRYVLDNSGEMPWLSIDQARLNESLYAGPFFQFLLHGLRAPPRRGMPPGTNRILLKQRRLARFGEEYNKQHGERQNKIYTAEQKRLKDNQNELVVRSGRRKLTRLRRDIVRRKLGKKQQLSVDSVPWFGKGPDPRGQTTED